MRVINSKKEKIFTHYIGRGSIFGNPYKIGRDGDRETVIKKYEKYARKNKVLMESIQGLPENAILGCFCKPKMCHGDVIIKLYKERFKVTILQSESGANIHYRVGEFHHLDNVYHFIGVFPFDCYEYEGEGVRIVKEFFIYLKIEVR